MPSAKSSLSRQKRNKGKLSGIGELALVESIQKLFKAGAKSGLQTGIGDDCAVIKPRPGNKLLLTTDMMIEDVHFDLRLITPWQLGYKLIAVNLSDIYAMGGKPAFALLNISMTNKTTLEFFDEFLDGVHSACKLFGVSLAGGDMSSSMREMSLSATLIGYANKPKLRSGAKSGDSIYVTSTLGDSAVGLALLKTIGRPIDFKKRINKPLEWKIMKPLLIKHLMPQPVDLSMRLPKATAMMDLSDGLFIDLHRLCTSSKVGAIIEKESIPISTQALNACKGLGLDAFKIATSGGEDYALLFTAPEGDYASSTRIGKIVSKGKGLSVVDAKGHTEKIEPEGYKHFED